MRPMPAYFDPDAKNAPPRRVVLLSYEDMNLLDLAGPLQALATVNRRSNGQTPAYEPIVASAAGGLVRTGSGLAVETVGADHA